MSPFNKITFVIFLQILRFCKPSMDSESEAGLGDGKRALMKSFGLDHLPRTAPRQSDFLLRRYSAPKFMMGLFEEVSKEAVPLDDGIHVNMSSAHFEMERKYLDESKVDTVISFFKYDHDKSWEHIHQDFKLKFKTKFNSREDVVKGGELKVFKRLPRNSSMIHENCTLSVYLISPTGNTLQHLDTRVVHAWTSGWHAFNVTAAVKMWAVFPLANHGLKIVVHHANEELSPHSFGMVGAHGSLEKRPYLLGFVATSRVLPIFTPEFVRSRERRDSQKRWKKAGNTQKECRLKKFYVDFKDIGWSSWIIAPTGYDMYFCDGLCSHPMSRKLKASNHAMIQSILNLAIDTVPSACCVPDDLKSISVLFFNDSGNIELKQYHKMIASSCTCS